MKFSYLLCLLKVSSGRVVDPDDDGWVRIKKTLDKENFNFFVLGDWGGWPAPLYQSVLQVNTATSMMRTAKDKKV